MSPPVKRPSRWISSFLVFALVPPAFAQNTETEGSSLETITVTAAKLRSLEQFTPTGSRLGLSARETPATLDVVDIDEMLGRGFSSAEEAANSLPGVTSGGSPGNPSQLSMRGFTGNQITVLHNGLYIGPANMTNRPQNTFNLQSVEILKGPASVLYGQGAVAGVINVVNKGPSFEKSSLDFLASAGRFGTTNLGIGGTTRLSDAVAIRADLSRTATDGYVRGLSADSLNGTVSLLWKATDTLDVQFSLDYLQDNPSGYFGTPLVPEEFAERPLRGAIESTVGLAIDERMRFVNYNVGDTRIHSTQYWPQLLLKWQPNAALTLENFTYYFDADRKWINAETYNFNPATELVDRDRFFVFHDQKLFGNQASATYRSSVLGRENTLVVGFDYSNLDFLRSRGFPDGDSVDPFNPSPGLFGPIEERLSPTRWNDFAVFFEDAIDLTARLKLVTGARHDRLRLDRENYNVDGSFNAATSFERTFNSTTWRVGAIFKLTPDITPYLSYTTGADPVGTNIFIVNAAESFSLSKSNQVEAGVKARFWDGRADLTTAFYHIERNDILTQTALETLSNVGGQNADGFEASLNIALLPNWTVSANTAYTDSRFEDFIDTATGIDASGNEPLDIPRWTGNLWTSLRNVAGTGLEVGGGMRYVGKRSGNTANTLRLQDYTLIDFYASYRLTPNLMIAGRLNNAFDKAFVQWADIFYPNQVMLGEPRMYEISLIGKF